MVVSRAEHVAAAAAAQRRAAGAPRLGAGRPPGGPPAQRAPGNAPEQRPIRYAARMSDAPRPPPPVAAAITRVGDPSPADLRGVRALLASVHLPADDVDFGRQDFCVAALGDEVIGCVALERYGDAALLRSLAVTPAHRGTGLGEALRDSAVEDARRSGIRALYLLTTTAEAFFARAGFTTVDRAVVPPAVAGSPEFRSLCPASAVCMVKRLAAR
jgi:amino-acid N-acetyltransferase